ncbi:MAG: serine--tRNA ligase [Fibrobacterota bacterium]|nr:serine--tRNA ligase [Fibrobacterota bacterium]
MLDPRLYREEVDKIRHGLERRGAKVDLDVMVNIDIEKRKINVQLDQLKSERNAATEQIAQLKRSKEAGAIETAQVAIDKTRTLGDEIKIQQEKFDELETRFKDMAMLVPNLPHSSVPDGRSAADNRVAREWGQKYAGATKPKHHLDVGKELGLFDFERGAKISGSGFPIYMGLGARLERALLNFFLDTHVADHGFTEVSPPFVVNKASMIGTGQLPKFEEDMYTVTADELYLIPTAEVPVTNMHGNEILDAVSLPISYVAYSACFRREAGSWGKDTRGFLRLHQFNKVEMVMFSDPAKSYDLHESLVSYAENLLQKLGLHYRVLELCAGDMGFGAAKCYDLEVWAPAEERWLEVSSVSNFEDFQARRANIRTKIGGKTQFVHTLNGSGLATPRVLVALLETHQTPEGGLRIPEVLQPYMGGLKEIKAKKK